MGGVKDNYRGQIANIASLPSVRVGELEVRVLDFAALLAIDPEMPAAEAARSPSLAAETGRLVARAMREWNAARLELEEAERQYRIWRDGVRDRLYTDEAYRAEAGMKSEGKVTKDSCAAFSRTLPTYDELSRSVRDAKVAVADAEEAYYVCKAIHEAAQSRTSACRVFRENGGAVDLSRPPIDREQARAPREYEEPAAPPPPSRYEEQGYYGDDGGDTVIDREGDTSAMEDAYRRSRAASPPPQGAPPPPPQRTSSAPEAPPLFPAEAPSPGGGPQPMRRPPASGGPSAGPPPVPKITPR